MLHEGEAEKRKAIAQVEKQLWDSEQELKKAATAYEPHSFDRTALEDRVKRPFGRQSTPPPPLRMHGLV